MVRLVAALACVLVLAGCATLPYTQMSPEQIAALSQIKDATAICVSGVYAGATVTTVSIAADKGVPAGIIIEQGCKTTFTSGASAPPKL